MSQLIARFDSTIHDFWGTHPPPTDESISRISKELRIQLPDLLIQLARESERFANIFLGLGDNYESHDHILPYNRYWRSRRRTRRLPPDLVIITNGFMDEDFNCLVRPKTGEAGPVAVEFWSPAPIGYPKDTYRGQHHHCFEAFLSALVAYHARQ